MFWEIPEELQRARAIQKKETNRVWTWFFCQKLDKIYSVILAPCHVLNKIKIAPSAPAAVSAESTKYAVAARQVTQLKDAHMTFSGVCFLFG